MKAGRQPEPIALAMKMEVADGSNCLNRENQGRWEHFILEEGSWPFYGYILKPGRVKVIKNVSDKSDGVSHAERGDRGMDENDHPKGALLFIVIYLVILAALWTNAYLHLWRG